MFILQCMLRRLYPTFARGMADNGKSALEKAGLPPESAASVSDAKWREILPEDVYEVTRQGGTEPPGAGEHLHNKKDGVYACICCGEQLFESQAKFESGCGWPAFYAAKGDDLKKKEATVEDECATSTVKRIGDDSYGMQRVEVRCKKCDAHLGHVFNDAPQWTPTGERYCINSICLTFKPKEGAVKPSS